MKTMVLGEIYQARNEQRGDLRTIKAYELLGEIIHQAIVDYAKLREKEDKVLAKLERLGRCKLSLAEKSRREGLLRDEWNFKDAREFLFTDRFEKFLEYYGVEDFVNVSYVRRFARSYNLKYGKNGKKYVPALTELMEEDDEGDTRDSKSR